MTIETIGELAGSAWTVWAVLLWTGIVAWAFRPSNRRRFEQTAEIPLNDER